MRSLFTSICMGVTLITVGQQYKSYESYVRFFSDAPMEDIEAVNRKGSSILDTSSGQVVFSIPISGFVFDKSLMQKHFNEKYMETEQFPKATFSGKLIDFKPGMADQELTAAGTITIHGIERDIKVTGSVSRQAGIYVLTSTFLIKPEDYKIDIPKLLWQNIAEEVEVTVKFNYKPL